MFMQTNRARSISLAVFAGLAVSVLGGCAARHAGTTGQTSASAPAPMSPEEALAAAWNSTKITANCVTKPTDIEFSLPDGTTETVTIDRYAHQVPYVIAELRLLPGSSILELIEGAARVQNARIVRVKPKRVTLGQNAGFMDITSTADQNNGNQYVVLERAYTPGDTLDVVLTSTGASVTLSADGDFAEVKKVGGVDTITKKSLTSLAPNDALLQTINRLKAAMTR
jgi:hypothetical protein